MQPILPLFCLVSLLALAPTDTSQAHSNAAPSTALSADLFPAAREGITIRVDPEQPGSSMTFRELLDEFTRVTSVAVQMDKDNDVQSRVMRVGLNRTVAVPATEVHRIVETLLRASDFAVVHLSDVEPRIWRVQSLTNGRGASQLRSDARVVAEEDLASWADHPATLITTTIALPNTDVRTLSNSMRTMFTDANTQNIIPVGDSGLIITGVAREVHALVRMLRQIDEFAGAGHARSQVAPNEPKRK